MTLFHVEFKIASVKAQSCNPEAFKQLLTVVIWCA